MKPKSLLHASRKADNVLKKSTASASPFFGMHPLYLARRGKNTGASYPLTQSHVHEARYSHLPPQATFTSGAPAPPCSTGCSPARWGGPSSSALKTRTTPAIRRRLPAQSSPAWNGWGWTGIGAHERRRLQPLFSKPAQRYLRRLFQEAPGRQAACTRMKEPGVSALTAPNPSPSMT